jgi:tetratricopeptide (TPR) repeat protein
MPGTVEFIESYFKQTLSSAERAAFEVRCTTDEAFAAEVAFYIAARQALREELLMQKVNAWKTEEDITQAEKAPITAEESAPVISMVKKPGIIRWVSYAAAACLILIASMFLFETKSASEKLAANYISAAYGHIPQSMGNSDSIQIAIQAYNAKNYDSALEYFKDVEARNPENSDVKEYVGLCYLQQKDYDNALKEFEALAAMDLHANSGNMLKATTLLLRNERGDKEEAKIILKKVVDEQQVGSEEAAEWLKKL